MEILSSRILLRPKDYAKSIAFYQHGLKLAIAREYPAGIVFFAGQSLIEVANHGRADDASGSFPGALWLQVRDVYETQADLQERGVPIARAAQQEPWGLHELHATDPDGVTVIFVQIPADHPLRRDNRG